MMPAQRTQRKLPAYGRELLALRRRGLVPTQYTVIVIDDWKLASAFPRVVVAEDADPRLLDFSMLADLDVTIVWRPTRTAIERRNAVVAEALAIAPASLRVFDLDNVDVLWVKSRARGIECPEYLQ
jgi:hypothetical protein